MKKFELGTKVSITKYYNRNGIKPKGKIRCDRYNLLDIDKVGIWIGKRRIYTKGYSEYEGYDEGYTFIPMDSEWVHLVAISPTRIVYVPDEFIREVEDKCQEK